MSKILAQKPKTKIDSKITPHSTKKDRFISQLPILFLALNNFSGMWGSFLLDKKITRSILTLSAWSFSFPPVKSQEKAPGWAIFLMRIVVELPDTAPGSDISSDMHSTSVVYSFISAYALGWNKQNLTQP